MIPEDFSCEKCGLPYIKVTTSDEYKFYVNKHYTSCLGRQTSQGTSADSKPDGPLEAVDQDHYLPPEKIK